jgi:two-component system phosphate regulon sensor histidine kinase PhoR
MTGRINIIWTRSLVALVLTGGAAGLAGLAAGPVAGLAVAVALLVAQALFNLFYTARLWRLLDAPAYGEVPSAPGLWGEIYYRLHKLAKLWHAQLRRVEQQHSRFIQAIQASPIGVIMLDDHNRIEWCNTIAGRHFGIDPRRDLAQHVMHLIRQPDFVRYLSAQHYDEELRMPGMGENRQNALAVQMFPYGDSRKLLLSQDVTEVERTDAMRRDFVANVSHELRTPLTVLAGFLETVRDLPLSDADRARYLNLMSQQAERMQNIVNDLLALARLEADPRPPLETVVDIDTMLERIAADARGVSGGKHEIRLESDATLAVRGAESELLSAFTNLVVNAVRYTPDGGSVTIGWQGDESGGARFLVTDTGIGIPQEHIPRLTERFYRVDRSRSRDTGGTGLGLAIVKHVLQRHQARLEIRSEAGRGSTFAVMFPEFRTVRARAQDRLNAAGGETPSRRRDAGVDVVQRGAGQLSFPLKYRIVAHRFSVGTQASAGQEGCRAAASHGMTGIFPMQGMVFTRDSASTHDSFP